MSLWGGDIQNNGPGTVGSGSTSNTLVDTSRPEPDDEWDSSYIVLNPGSSSNVIWRRVADTNGWVQNTGTLTIVGSWPAPYTNGPTAGTPYELFKVFRPEAWLQAINYALEKSYPKRHRPVSFEVPQNNATRIIDYGRLAKQINTLSTPALAPVLTEIADGTGAFQPGTYTLTYTFFNDFGETLQAPTATITIVGTNSRVDIGEISNVPAGALGANYYCSIQPNDTTLDMLDMGNATVIPDLTSQNTPMNARLNPGWNLNGRIMEIQISTPNPWMGVSPPSYNTTSVDFYRLHQVLQRINPGSFPEMWNAMDPSLIKKLGGTQIMLEYLPVSQLNLRLICTTMVPTLAAETDITQEPTELIYEGAEAYLWNLQVKTSTIVNVNWQKLHDASWANFQTMLNSYAMDIPRDFKYVPIIKVQY